MAVSGALCCTTLNAILTFAAEPILFAVFSLVYSHYCTPRESMPTFEFILNISLPSFVIAQESGPVVNSSLKHTLEAACSYIRNHPL